MAAEAAACRGSLGSRVNQGSQVDLASPGARAEPGEQAELGTQAEPVATAAEAVMGLQEVAAAMAFGAVMEGVPDRGSDRVTGREKGERCHVDQDRQHGQHLDEALAPGLPSRSGSHDSIGDSPPAVLAGIPFIPVGSA